MDYFWLISVLKHAGYEFRVELSGSPASGGSFFAHEHRNPWEGRSLDVYEKIYRMGAGKYKERHTLSYYRDMTESEFLEYLHLRDNEIITMLQLEANQIKE